MSLRSLRVRGGLAGGSARGSDGAGGEREGRRRDGKGRGLRGHRQGESCRVSRRVSLRGSHSGSLRAGPAGSLRGIPQDLSGGSRRVSPGGGPTGCLRGSCRSLLGGLCSQPRSQVPPPQPVFPVHAPAGPAAPVLQQKTRNKPPESVEKLGVTKGTEQTSVNLHCTHYCISRIMLKCCKIVLKRCLFREMKNPVLLHL